MNLLEKKILGCLVGAAAADALGAATELRTTEQIIEKFGGWVEDFISPPDDTFARGNKPGQVTDDFSCAYVTCQEIIKNNGEINEETTKQGLLEWAKVDEFFQRFAGPTTRAAVEALKGVAQPPLTNGLVLVNDNSKASNGGAMKMSPIALFSGGDVDKAIDIALLVCKWTHNNNIALSGAAAVAAATAKAMDETATLEDVINAGLYGAKKGDELGRERGKTLAGPSVYKRIELANKIGKESSSITAAMEDISDIVGTGLAAAEAVPAAFGLMSATKGNTKDAIMAAVNIGNDTDTVATIVGGILGTLNGIDSLPSNYLTILDEANNFDLEKMAKIIRSLI